MPAALILYSLCVLIQIPLLFFLHFRLAYFNSKSLKICDDAKPTENTVGFGRHTVMKTKCPKKQREGKVIKNEFD